jgi:hypothetical protein
VLAKEQRCRDLVECAATLEEFVLAKEQRCQELAESAVALAETLLANKQLAAKHPAAACSTVLVVRA